MYQFNAFSLILITVWQAFFKSKGIKFDMRWNPRGGENDNLFHISVYRLEPAKHQHPFRLSAAASK
jgi:hypothetical protein